MNAHKLRTRSWQIREMGVADRFVDLMLRISSRHPVQTRKARCPGGKTAWRQSKSQVHNVTLLWSSGDGDSFRLRFGLLTRNGSGQRYLDRAPEVIAASLQPQVLIWAEAFSLTPPKHASVPV